MTKQKGYTKKIQKFLSTEYTPEDVKNIYTPKKNDWYIRRYPNYIAIFNIINTTPKGEMSVDYWMALPGRTSKINAIVTEINRSMWKPIGKPEAMEWNILLDLCK